jgi:hypothetical protein
MLYLIDQFKQKIHIGKQKAIEENKWNIENKEQNGRCKSNHINDNTKYESIKQPSQEK